MAIEVGRKSCVISYVPGYFYCSLYCYVSFSDVYLGYFRVYLFFFVFCLLMAIYGLVVVCSWVCYDNLIPRLFSCGCRVYFFTFPPNNSSDLNFKVADVCIS